MRRFVMTLSFALAVVGSSMVASAADEKQAPTQKNTPVQSPTQKGPVQKGEAAQQASKQSPVQKDCGRCARHERGCRRGRCG